MKKKYLVYCLALSMALSVPTPIFAAEQIEVAENSNVDSESCEESEEIIVPVDSENLEIEDESTEVGSFTEDVENSNSAEDDSVVLFSDGNDFAEFTGDEAETDGWIQSEQVEGLAFKYDANNQTLYLKSEKAVALPDYKQSGWTSEWRNKYGAELNNVKTIEIQGEITQIGEFNFNNGRAGAYDNLETVKLSPSVTKIAASAFGEVATLKSINLNKVKEIGTAAFWKTGLENVTLDDEETIIADNAFSECTSLTSVTVKGIKSLGMNAYDGCTSLSTFNCEGNIESIPMKCFQNTGITAFDFKNVSSVGRNAFNKSNLKSACYAGTKEQWDSMIPAASWSGATIPEGTVVHCKADAVEAKDATCTEDGWKEVGVCEVCGVHYSYPTDENKLPATGHAWSEDYVVDKEATCTEAGEKSKHCTICDAKEDVQEIPALGHDFVSKVTKKATCTTDGILTYTCSRCNETKTETIKATGHKWSNWKRTAAATVFKPEVQTRKCSACNKSETRNVGKKLAPKATLNASTVTLKVKQSTSGLKVTRLAKGDSVKFWKSSNSKIFTVRGKSNGTCKITGKKRGTAKLQITLASGLKKTVKVRVQTAAVKTSKITVSKNVTVRKGKRVTLKPVVTPFTSRQKVTYTSSNKKIATVSSKGVVTGKKKGTVKITVKSGSKSVKVTVKVK